ncbi:response regulator [Xanthobacter sp. DSM 24535]|uniref:response regulator n=1 Tax=Roseixanthobacter psychrophilus TaxID=3119917 RepID=UPI003727053E
MPQTPQPRGSALLVEDEPFVAMVASQILADEGFSVVEASSAAQALGELDGRPGDFALAVVDLGLPDMRGEALVQALRSRASALPIIIASGYGMGELQDIFTASVGVALVSKPYDTAALRGALAKLGFAVGTD